ncbi:hypothetical protein LXM94_07810 [Rhizobium sp. TRM95111]|uniref:hypothetical protein n=1 Tax=Rhizobium alarense TaxID=2846851 RepID=UPI001F467C3B|nr:hypothetical protein [Rhizobium alarense]MCF3639872.1 hypothetical protein [Rhizobium alarense]
MSDFARPYLDKPSLLLMRRTAEVLDLPHTVCRRRSCRRANRCRWSFRETGMPCCRANLTPSRRWGFDAIVDLAARMRDNGGRSEAMTYASRHADERLLENLAVLVGWQALAGWQRRLYRRFLKLRAKAPPPDLPGFDPTRPPPPA